MKDFAFIHQSTVFGQILLTNDYDVDSQTHKVTIRVQQDGLDISAAIQAKSEENAKIIFDNFKDEARLISLISDLIPS